MRKLLTRVLGSKPVETGAGTDSLPTLIEAGQVYSFRTRPVTDFSPTSTGRFAAIKILGSSDSFFAVAVLDGIWGSSPTLSEVRSTSILNEHRFAHTGKPAVYGVGEELWAPLEYLDEYTFLGKLPVSRKERSLFSALDEYAPGTSWGSLYLADQAAEGEWRWSNDRKNVVIEYEKREAKNKAERVAREERYRTRLSKLTWEQLESETPFDKWAPSPPFPPAEFTDAARLVIRSACSDLKELGSKPRRADVRAVLKKTVIWFNEADDGAGGVIETEEREDIFAVLEEMAHVARQKVLVDEIDEWREW
ncbi:MAG: hypothetical protein ABJ205_03600 [Erythrobacter sp.]|uniref:hypothetical protein n=1 Tax=Erythrobacter sp. TaxID=1042 RepID=UPI003267D380